MKSARIALVIGTALGLLLGSPPRARAAEPDRDDWLGPDKAKHFGVSAGLAAVGYAGSAALLDARGHALILGGAVAFGAGVTKELLDLSGLGDPSWKDLTWDALGTVSGLAVAWSLDLLVRGVSAKHPLLVAPTLDRGRVGLNAIVRF